MSTARYRYSRGQWYLVTTEDRMTTLIPVDPELAAVLSEEAREIHRQEVARARRVRAEAERRANDPSRPAPELRGGRK